MFPFQWHLDFWEKLIRCQIWANMGVGDTCIRFFYLIKIAVTRSVFIENEAIDSISPSSRTIYMFL